MGVILKQLGVQSRNQGSSFGTTWLSDTGQMIDSVNPANNAAIASIWLSDPENYSYIVNAAQQAQVEWSKLPTPQRAEIIRCIAESLREKKDFLGTLISLETGKPKSEGDAEVQDMISMADLVIGQAHMPYGMLLPSEQIMQREYEQWLPLGVCGIITDFTTPAAAWALHAFLAVICGNVVIWKPSPKTPLVAVAIHHICQSAMASLEMEGVFSLVNSQDTSFIENIVNDTHIGLIAFSGARDIGNSISVKAASRQCRCIRSLNGNNAAIIDPSADTNLVLDSILQGAISTKGQLRHLIVHEQMIDSIIARLQHAYSQLRCGDPLEGSHFYAPLIDEEAVIHYKDLIARIKGLDGHILSGGESIDMAGNFVQPTLVLADPQWPLLQQEYGLPIVFIMPYKDIEEAMTLSNATHYTLSCTLFATDMRVVEHFLSIQGSRGESANINVVTSRKNIICPDSWKSYMRRQIVTINWGPVKKEQIQQDYRTSIVKKR